MLTLRFAMRAPALGAPATNLYAAAIDMCARAEENHGCLAAVLCERLSLSPLCGGMPPDVAWRYLKRIGGRVPPAAAHSDASSPDGLGDAFTDLMTNLRSSR